LDGQDCPSYANSWKRLSAGATVALELPLFPFDQCGGKPVAVDPVLALQRLIQTPSVNPMGHDVAGPIYGEGRLTDLLEHICEQQGWRRRRQPVHPGRENLLMLVEGRPTVRDGGELIVWDAHQDTVPVEGMTIEPFAGAVHDGRIYGRGACDVKGSLAAMLTALARRSEVAPAACPTIILACTVNEECGFTGAHALCELWTSCTELFPRPPDSAIVAEPTGFNVVVAHQGQVRWRCHTIGRAAHTSRPDAGVNANYAMAPVVQAIERFHTRLLTSGPAHPLCGRPSVCVSTIGGGVAINTVPDRATIEIDRRLSPDESPSEARGELVRYIADNTDVGRCKVEHDPPFMQSSGMRSDRNAELAERLAALVREHGRSCESVGAPYGTDASPISAAGVPTVVFGPGSIDQAHTADEFIEISELELATEIFYQLACHGLRPRTSGRQPTVES
jgi:acetylornithine deacetylase